MNLTMIQCPICSMKFRHDDYHKKFKSSYNGQEYKLFHCLQCDLAFWSPLKIIPEFYEQNSEGLYRDMHTGTRDAITEDHKLFFKYFDALIQNLLDVGCGDGVFLQKAKSLGIETYGIDLDRNSLNVAKNKRGLQNTYHMTQAEFASFVRKNNLSFDVVTFFEVLEHQDNPVRFIRHVLQILNHGGYIAGSVPNRDRLFAGVDRMKNFEGDLPPHHFLWFSEKSLRYFLRSQNFHNIQIYPVANLSTLIALIEAAFMRRFTLLWKLRDFLKYSFKRKSESKKHPEISGYKRPSERKFYLLLKMTRFLIFFPVALLLFSRFKKRKGYQLYFQSQRTNH